MSDFGIICEMNPLHRGHEYLLRQARERGAERIVCVMSGNAVQRGELAVAEKYLRAEILLRCGADLVLELPFPWCAGSAEFFSRGAVSILRHFCDKLIFGSESGDLMRLWRGAAIVGDPQFQADYRETLSLGGTSVGDYQRLLREYQIGPFSSNDILAVEYIRAANELHAVLKYLPIQREGAGYGQTELCDEEYPSATALRRMWREGRFEETVKHLPEVSVEVWRRAKEEGLFFDEGRLDPLLVTFFCLHDGVYFETAEGAGGGLGNYLCATAREVKSAAELREALRTKRYTDARLRRLMLNCLCGVTQKDLSALPAYTTLLAANERGRTLLAEKRKTGDFPVVTKPADAPKESRQFLLGQRIDAVYAACLERPRSAAELFAAGRPFIQ